MILLICDTDSIGKKVKRKIFTFFRATGFTFLHQLCDKKRKRINIKRKERNHFSQKHSQRIWLNTVHIADMSSPFIVESQPDINGEKDGCFWCGIQCPVENICSLCSDGIHFCSPDHLKNHYYVVAR